VRDGRLEQISVDHSHRQELLEAGADPESIRVGRNVITRALGAGSPGVPVMDQWLRPARRGDRVLVCSDGLNTEVTDPLILATLLASPDPQEAARALVSAALTAAGRDNVTAVVVDALVVSSATGDDGDGGDDEDTLSPPELEVDDDTVDLGEHGHDRGED